MLFKKVKSAKCLARPSNMHMWSYRTVYEYMLSISIRAQPQLTGRSSSCRWASPCSSCLPSCSFIRSFSFVRSLARIKRKSQRAMANMSAHAPCPRSFAHILINKRREESMQIILNFVFQFGEKERDKESKKERKRKRKKERL